jgi:hypothetical protein
MLTADALQKGVYPWWIARAILAGHPDVEGLCLALSDWSAELRILENEKRRRADTRRRDAKNKLVDQALTE